MSSALASPRLLRSVRIPCGDVVLNGELALPENASGVVVFAHGSGSSRFSPRNEFVARTLQAAGTGTLLMDLLTSDEEDVDQASGRLRFDVGLLAERLICAFQFVADMPETRGLPIGFFGASTGSAAALAAAARLDPTVKAVVSRGGRPDLAGPALRQVTAPALLIVGGKDEMVLRLNRDALAELPGEKSLAIVPGATHLFEEPGALDAVARLASAWFSKHFAK